MRGRRSVRAFLATPVPQATVAEILALAACAPSGTNIQPWQVIALAGGERQRLCDRAQQAFHHEAGQHASEYPSTRPNGSSPTWGAGAAMAWRSMRRSASSAATRPRCSASMRATSPSSMRPWG
uniref:nitroreductase family protein n=1 Tax=Variovorax saccharolyticus TaxID=3053516 RepID=UPI003369E8C2